MKNNAYINEEVEPKLVIQRLKDELKRVGEEVSFLQGENGEGNTLTDKERLDLQQRIKLCALGGGIEEVNIGAITHSDSLFNLQRIVSETKNGHTMDLDRGGCVEHIEDHVQIIQNRFCHFKELFNKEMRRSKSWLKW